MDRCPGPNSDRSFSALQDLVWAVSSTPRAPWPENRPFLRRNREEGRGWGSGGGNWGLWSRLQWLFRRKTGHQRGARRHLKIERRLYVPDQTLIAVLPN